ncbi:MAG: ribosome biogenesis GTPase Der [Ignavibacteria bacterium GWB2_35_12]|nr:MAG: ribosome biogenesis GTPase Der [Ignavibacteria bacterium GWA2_35_8]OGU42245.1 MAG: ribosome biogenesis GTPase Der [Ignavibacteria bacterium GWB2_35_12]OGU92784.1 MAG: ribosome biogenesis GTPase Der [Ignavibacteria bacterium RIFOXYA2_FULL_35_10]OGV20060.1 MAG: ribosome biogenesis GTPase Der [Ignavibacteria bacterium RIFOXYC2_FULL_35_21]
MSLVAIVGRPNVGKSTLFNRIVGSKDAIVEGTPGVTRDRIYGESDWNGKNFHIVDTGGFVPGSENTIEKAIREQAFIAIDEADAIIFVCDGKEGITPFDLEIAKILRSSSKPITLVINKCDNSIQDAYAFEFHRLGLSEPYAVSSVNGRGTGDFLDEVVSYLKEADLDTTDDRLKIAIVGRPNVGKSSITNTLLGKNRSIVTDIPGTTRDAIDSIVKYYGEEIILIDTAGLRKKSQIKENIELYSTIRTSKAIERCDVAVVVLDSMRGLEEQDKRIINQVTDERKGILIAVNKWDLVEKDNATADAFVRSYHNIMKTHDYVPLIFISALTKQRVTKIIEHAKKIHERRQVHLSTSKLNKILLPELEKTPPPSAQGKDLRLNYITQVRTSPQVFAFFGNHPQLIPDSYKRFIENTMRKHFDFEGTPISLIFRRKNKRWEEIQENEGKK